MLFQTAVFFFHIIDLPTSVCRLKTLFPASYNFQDLSVFIFTMVVHLPQQPMMAPSPTHSLNPKQSRCFYPVVRLAFPLGSFPPLHQDNQIPPPSILLLALMSLTPSMLYRSTGSKIHIGLFKHRVSAYSIPMRHISIQSCRSS